MKKNKKILFLVNDLSFFISHRLLIAETVSPPPRTDINDFVIVFSEIFLAIKFVPLASIIHCEVDSPTLIMFPNLKHISNNLIILNSSFKYILNEDRINHNKTVNKPVVRFFNISELKRDK